MRDWCRLPLINTHFYHCRLPLCSLILVHILNISLSSTFDAPTTVPVGNHSIFPHTGLIFINATTMITFNLSKGDNYASWHAQFSNLLFGYDLLCYVDGSLRCPPMILNILGAPNQVPNPDHKQWLHQDRLILQTIQALVAGSLALLISSCNNAVEA